jgi:hypothetical protein
VHTRRPTFLRWIEEAEGRRLLEQALLEPHAKPSVTPARPPIAAALLPCPAPSAVPTPFFPAGPVMQRDDRPSGRLLCFERRHRA